MKNIYKVISIFMILILISTTAMAAKPMPTPTPTPNPEQVQNARLTTLETNDTLQKTNNSVQQGLINGLINQIALLSNRLSNIENNQSQIYIFGNRQVCCKSIGNGWNNWSEITNYTFYLPVDSYVYVESSGSIENFYDYAAIDLGVDSNAYGDTTNYRGYGEYPVGSSYTRQSGFQVSDVYHLTKGYHTIYLDGWAGYVWSGITSQTYVSGISFNVITDQKGSQVQQMTDAATTNIGKSTINKEGKTSTT